MEYDECNVSLSLSLSLSLPLLARSLYALSTSPSRMNDTLRDTLKGNAAVACIRVATLRDTARESARSMKIITNNKSAKRNDATPNDAERR